MVQITEFKMVSEILWYFESQLAGAITIIMWFDPVLYVMVVPMLAAHALMGISIRNPLFLSDRLCMTTIYSFTLRDRRLCLFASAALTWLMPLCNGACPISAVVGIAILVPCCLGRVTAAHFVFGHLWISFTGVRSLGCGDLSFVKGCRRGGL